MPVACVGGTWAIPHCIVSRGKRSYSTSFGGSLLVSAGVSLILLISSKNQSCRPMLGMFRVG